jgi:hypothetical protein
VPIRRPREGVALRDPHGAAVLGYTAFAVSAISPAPDGPLDGDGPGRARFLPLVRVRPAMELLLVGMSHRTASLGIREGLALNGDEVRRALRLARDEDTLRETLVLSTCNRSEFYRSRRSRARTGLAVRPSARDPDLSTLVVHRHTHHLWDLRRQLLLRRAGARGHPGSGGPFRPSMMYATILSGPPHLRQPGYAQSAHPPLVSFRTFCSPGYLHDSARSFSLEASRSGDPCDPGQRC